MCPRTMSPVLAIVLLSYPFTLGGWSQDSDSATSPGMVKQAAKTAMEDDSTSKNEPEGYYDLLMTFADTIDQVDRNYVEKVSRRELMEAAIEGVLKKLDPYSSYIAPDELDEFKVEVENEFGGIGIQISSRNGQLSVISPLLGTPAYSAGVTAGDLILTIDGTPTRNMTISDAIKLMKGRPGTDLNLTVFHPLKGETADIKLTREVIKVETVLGDRRSADDKWKHMYDDATKIGYVRVTAFGRETATDLENVLSDLQQQGLRGLILDLRFNSGGLLKSAIEVSDMFLSSGTIVSTKGRNIKRQTWAATSKDTYEGFPMVVMVNQFSASASEIVAAALQDHDRAVVIGQQTFGKASVQNVVELEGGKSALKITTGSYQRPSGKPIHRFPGATEWGVRPNDTFGMPLSNYDLQRLVTRRRDRDIIKDQSTSEPTSSFDAQLRRAITYLQAEIGKTEQRSP